jgi:hypothetical protein
LHGHLRVGTDPFLCQQLFDLYAELVKFEPSERSYKLVVSEDPRNMDFV